MSARTAVLVLLALSAGTLLIGTFASVMAAVFLLDAAILVHLSRPRH